MKQPQRCGPTLGSRQLANRKDHLMAEILMHKNESQVHQSPKRTHRARGWWPPSQR